LEPSGTRGESTGILQTACEHGGGRGGWGVAQLKVDILPLTSAKLVDDVGAPQAAQVSPREPTQQPDARPKPLDRGRDERTEIRIPAVENHRDQRPSSLRQLVDDVYAIWLLATDLAAARRRINSQYVIIPR
jgi:hypothetical protein